MANARKKKWRDLSTPQRVLVVIVGTVQVGLLLAAQIDIQRRPASKINGSKLRWRLICLINIAGPLSYFRWGRTRSSSAA